MTRCTLYILLPISIVASLFFVWQGSIQNFKGPATVQTLEGTPQTIEQGPLASQLAIKMLGTNGGGYFNANSSHPYENPSPLSNLVQMMLIFVLGAGLTYQFGKMVRDTRQGWAIFATMSVLFLAGAFICYWAEQRGNPMTAQMGIESTYTSSHPGGNMEGKEVRLGNTMTALFATVTTDASCGVVIGMQDSFTLTVLMSTNANPAAGEQIYPIFSGTYAEDLLGSAVYGARFACAAERDNVFGVQFHPEKSSAAGLRLLSNFAGVCAKSPVAAA